MGIMETVLEIPAEHEANVFGQFDAFAKKIERSLHVTLISRDGVVKIMGDSNAVERAKEMYSHSFLNYPVEVTRFQNKM